MENKEALGNPNYNPQFDETSLKLFQLMEKPDEQLYQQYRQVYDGFPTKNPYQGVIYNQNTCDIDDIKNLISQVVNQMKTVPSQLSPSDRDRWNTEILDTSSPNSAVSQLTGGNQIENPDGSTGYVVPNSVLGAVEKAQDHTDKFLANLPSILGAVTAGLGLATILNGLLNPCSGLGGFIGSLTGALKPLLKGIKASIQKINDLIDLVNSGIAEAIRLIQDAIQYVMSLAKQLVDFIEKEINLFINALIDSLRMGLSSFLSSLGLDPCLKSVAHNFMTTAATGLF